MWYVLKYFYCFYVFMFISTLLPGDVSGQIAAEGVYKLLSWRLDDILTETKYLKSKVDNIDTRLKSLENNMLEIQTAKSNSIELRIKEDTRELQKALTGNIERQLLAVKKMMYTEKKLLRDYMNNFNAAFVDFNTEIQHNISQILQTMGRSMVSNIEKTETRIITKVDKKQTGSTIDRNSGNVDTTIVTCNVGDTLTMECIVPGTPLQAITWSRDGVPLPKDAVLDDGELIIPQVKIEDAGTYTCTAVNKAGSLISKVVLYVRGPTETTLNYLQTSLSTLSATVSSISYKQTYTIQQELKSLSSRISSVSLSLSSESSSLSSRISSLSHRIYEEEKRKVAFSARIFNQSDSIYLPYEKIIFDQVYYNEGSGYNSSSGIFTAPKTGTYVFTVNIEATSAGKGHVSVIVRGDSRCQALAAKGYDNTGGCTAVAYVKSGEQVWVQASTSVSQQYVNRYRSQFNGFLID